MSVVACGAVEACAAQELPCGAVPVADGCSQALDLEAGATAAAVLPGPPPPHAGDARPGGELASPRADHREEATTKGESCSTSGGADSSSFCCSRSEPSSSAEAAPVKPRAAWREWADRCYAWLYPLARPAGGGAKAAGTPRLEALDAPRWIASIQIVCYHMYGNRETPFKRYGLWFAMWTQLFFLLSGFVLAYAELAKPPKVGSARPSVFRYVRRRLTVIYPAFLLSLLLKVAYAPGQSAFQWSMLPLHALLMQSWLPICQTVGERVDCSPWMYNGESWFLSVLLIFWLFLRPLAEFFRRRGLRSCAATLLACWAFSYVFQWLGDEDRLAHLLGCTDAWCPYTIMVAIRATPLGYTHVFIAGVAAARVFMLMAMSDAETGGRVGAATRRVTLTEEKAPLVLRYGCCFGYTAYACLILFCTRLAKPYYFFFHNGGLMPLMVLVLLGAAIGKDPITTWLFRSKPMLVLGRISYMQYLMQHVLQGWMSRAFGWNDNMVAQALFVPALLVFSYCCQRWVEKPYTQYQRWREEKGIKGLDDRLIEWAEGVSRAMRGGCSRRASRAEALGV